MSRESECAQSTECVVTQRSRDCGDAVNIQLTGGRSNNDWQTREYSSANCKRQVMPDETAQIGVQKSEATYNDGGPGCDDRMSSFRADNSGPVLADGAG